MKKRFFFDCFALLTIAAGFFVLFCYQDFDSEFLDKLKTPEEDILKEYTVYEDKTYIDKKDVPPKQVFVQPSEEELVNCYYYSILSDEEKAIYAEVCSVLESMDENKEISTLDTELLDKVFRCVMNDHPEFYYVDGYSYVTYTQNDQVVKLELSGRYTKTKEECEVLDLKIKEYVQNCFTGITPVMSDYEKVKYIYNYIIEKTEYDMNAADNQNICSVFLNGESVCMGYAKAMQYLLLEQDILCTLVKGTANYRQEHAWNLLLLDGQYYHLDVTWGDDSYTVANAADSKVGMTNYSFFCVTTEEIMKTHTIDSVMPLPECIAWENNYYVKEGLYLESADMEKMATIFKEAYAGNKEYVEIKCADKEVYGEIYSYLIDEQHIFDYLDTKMDTISYYAGDELLLFEFWLK